ncbi:C-type lectin domain-containing protein [Butyrivibrio sp. VCB2001]|uniref:C-type lectin domain-containing protein n=1 Tax=Butyrivibrio sp. VCB2001 TaxID=1280667 RepID=UPI0004027391|nr:C-type lectin domain-containing protein [Butyrivibrio sp. VCB2001]
MAIDLNKEKKDKVSLSKKVNLSKRPLPRRKVNLSKGENASVAGVTETSGIGSNRTGTGSMPARENNYSTGAGPLPVREDDYRTGSSGQKSKILMLGFLIPILAIILIIVAVSTFRGSGKSDVNGGGDETYVSDSDTVAQVSDTESADAAEVSADITNTDNAIADDVATSPENGDSDTSLQEVTTSAKTDDTAIHDYEVIVADVTWEEAFQDCIRRGGYLCRINSEEESEMVKALLDAKDFKGVAYLGGLRDADSKEYHWVDIDKEPFDEVLNNGELNAYWLPGEPSFRDNVNGEEITESYMSILYPASLKTWVWNDVTNDVLSLSESYYRGRLAYICEFE